MNCEQVEEQLSAYLDNALAPEEYRAVALHVERCSRCQVILADFRRFDTLLSQLPRLSPDAALRDRIFTSQEYPDLTGTRDTGLLQELTTPHASPRRDGDTRPQFTVLPGGHRPAGSLNSSQFSRYAPTVKAAAVHAPGSKKAKGSRGTGAQFVMQLAIAAALLLAVGLTGLVTWNSKHGHDQTQVVQHSTSITPPAGLAQGPLPIGMRFVFLRNGALWSSSSDNATSVARLTPSDVVVAPGWTIRPARTGQSAGDLVAYIDQQRAQIHIIRSDGQGDTIIPQPLLNAGTQFASVLHTSEGDTILGSLAWSADGSMLAFAADPLGTDPGLYVYTVATNELYPVTLPTQGSIARLAWSPDSLRIAFTATHNGGTSVYDYNTHSHDVLTVTSQVSTQANSNDTVLTLDWAASATTPAIIWSVGTSGHVHSLWLRHVGGVASNANTLMQGDYAQALYSRAYSNTGGWLLLKSHAGRTGDLLAVDLNAQVKTLTNGKGINFAQWSPNASYVSYIDAPPAGTGSLHVLDVSSRVDSTIAGSAGTLSTPAPLWSADSQGLLYSTGVTILVTTVTPKQTMSTQTVPLKGPASAFSWILNSTNQIILGVGNGQPGIYTVDLSHHTSTQLDKNNGQGPILWTQIP